MLAGASVPSRSKEAILRTRTGGGCEGGGAGARRPLAAKHGGGGGRRGAPAYPAGEPKVHPELLGLPNVVLAPHIASASHDTRIQMANLAVENCLAVLEGRTPPTPVNPEVLKRR